MTATRVTSQTRSPLRSMLTQQELETRLWAAANSLRGPVDPADFKAYIFPLLFFKRVSDAWDDEHARAVADFGDALTPEIEADYHRFQLPEGCHWRDLRRVHENVGVGLLGGAPGGQQHARHRQRGAARRRAAARYRRRNGGERPSAVRWCGAPPRRGRPGHAIAAAHRPRDVRPTGLAGEACMGRPSAGTIMAEVSRRFGIAVRSRAHPLSRSPDGARVEGDGSPRRMAWRASSRHGHP